MEDVLNTYVDMFQTKPVILLYFVVLGVVMVFPELVPWLPEKPLGFD